MRTGSDKDHLLHVLQQALLVPLPLLVEVVTTGILAAAQLHRHLEVVGEDVVEVLHPAVQGVPVRSVSDTVIEEPPAMMKHSLVTSL